MTPIDESRLWTVAEVAEHMRVSNMTVYRLIKAGHLPAVRVGKNYRIRDVDLGEYLEASRTGRRESQA
ncbi:MAG: helix-turn-helix domain-containing protein [Egibacteraceae bacterium]